MSNSGLKPGCCTGVLFLALVSVYYERPCKNNMTRKEDKNLEVIGSARPAASIGTLLLTLCNALQEVERCRIALKAMGYSQKRWQEIVNDVNPELRFVLRAQMLDL